MSANDNFSPELLFDSFLTGFDIDWASAGHHGALNACAKMDYFNVILLEGFQVALQ
jgi:hypothetical protein